MASLQQIVRNLNSKPTSMSLNERFAMLASARQQAQQSQPAPIPQQQVSRGWSSPPQSAPVQFTSPGKGGIDFGSRMAAARMRSANRGSPIGVISGKRRGGQRSPIKGQMRSPEMQHQQRVAEAFLRKASAQNRRLAAQMLARPTAVRLAQKLKKRSVMQRLGAKTGQSPRRRALGLPGKRRSFGGLGSPKRGSPMRAGSLLAGRLGAKKLSLSQRLGPKKQGGSPQKKNNQQQPLQNQQNQQQGGGRQFRRRGGRRGNRGGNFNNNNSGQQQQQQNQQQRQNFNRQRGGRRRGRGPNNQQNRGQPSKQSLDADMDSYWNK